MMKNKSIKKVTFIGFFTGMLLLLSGCWDRIEMNDLAIVTATGIDKTDDGQVELSLEIFIPKSFGGSTLGGSGGGGGASGDTTMVASHKGRNFADALSKLQTELPRKVFWGSCKIFIFGEEAAKEGIQEHLDFLARHRQTREKAFVMVSEGKAKSLLDVKSTLERYSAETLREVSSRDRGTGVTLQDLDEMLVNKYQSAFLPYVTITADEDKITPKHVVLNGTAILKEDRMIGVISESANRGILWLNGKLKDHTVTFQPDGEKGKISIFLVNIDINKKPLIEDGEWKMRLDIQAEGAIYQNSTSMTVNDPKAEKKVKEAFKSKIQSHIQKSLEETQELKADIAGYGKEFHRKHPQEWTRVKENWQEMFPEIKTEFKIDAHIQWPGLIQEPIKGSGAQ
ncbi:Ger(x)C family spore germination protein [Siminovitchia sediminis]|uniref:Ger(X)C family spore germination protein n=1 Tax=Siminovitchia sediminis TaxID=1274353 RepID=A0ABW4KHB1_9BACI